jgi:hypothetical protein
LMRLSVENSTRTNKRFEVRKVKLQIGLAVQNVVYKCYDTQTETGIMLAGLLMLQSEKFLKEVSEFLGKESAIEIL